VSLRKAGVEDEGSILSGRGRRSPGKDVPGRLADKPRAKCIVAIERLAERGHELRRPEADYLRDGIYELRKRLGTVNYRILYFFHGRNVAVVSHGCTKRDKVPPREIDLAVERKEAFEANPKKHTASE